MLCIYMHVEQSMCVYEQGLYTFEWGLQVCLHIEHMYIRSEVLSTNKSHLQ